MHDSSTVDRLASLKLHGMLDAFERQHATAQSTKLGFDERFAMLVEAEWLHRDNLRLARTLKEAKLKISNAIEEIDFPARRELDKSLVRQLTTCRWVHEHHNVLITGATGLPSQCTTYLQR